MSFDKYSAILLLTTHNFNLLKANLLTQIILGLSSNRPFFYSEADFQHCLAKALMEYGPVYLEYPLDGIHIDIMLEEDGWYYPIELKYKTSTIECADLFNNTTRLKNHGAADLARYDFWKDVFRIEQLKKKYVNAKVKEGYAIILTNDSKLWKTPNPKTIISQKFLLDTSTIVGFVEWKGTKDTPDYIIGKNKKTKYLHFSLNKKYIVPEWTDYGSGYIYNQTNKFKFLMITI